MGEVISFQGYKDAKRDAKIKELEYILIEDVVTREIGIPMTKIEDIIPQVEFPDYIGSHYHNCAIDKEVERFRNSMERNFES